MEFNAPAFCREWNILPEGATVLCAVSGGADSMCLLHWLSSVKDAFGIRLQAAHYNHHLRGDESDRDEQFVRGYCREWNIPLICGGGDVAARAAQLGRGLEETAREMRYAFLQETARQVGAELIAVAHNADDNAETMLLHLIRGSGLTGLTGMLPRRDNVVRPLLTTTRAVIEEYCAAHSVLYVQDSTNTDDAYSRNRVRHRIVPELTAMNPRFVENSVRMLERLRDDESYLISQTNVIYASTRKEGECIVIPAAVIGDLPEALAPRAVRRLLAQAGQENCSAAHLESVVELCRKGDPSARVCLPGLIVRREYDRLVFDPRQEPVQVSGPILVVPDGEMVYGDTGWTVDCRLAVCPENVPKNPDCFFLSRGKIKGIPVLRPRRTGDSIKLPGRSTKTIKKLLIDEKVPLVQRDCLPVLADDDGVLALAGFGPNEDYLAQPGEPALRITLEKE